MLLGDLCSGATLALMPVIEKAEKPMIVSICTLPEITQKAGAGGNKWVFRSVPNDIMLAKMIDALVDIYPHIPVCMHQDHGNGPATCATAIQYGFTSVMMDGSLLEDAKTPATYEYNVDVTRKVVQMAHSCGVSVEGELGVLGSLETGMGEAEDGHGFEGKLDHSALLTDPDQAVDFVRETQVDALAIAMGTSHGAYKFTRKPDGDVLAMNVIEEIHRRLPNIADHHTGTLMGKLECGGQADALCSTRDDGNLARESLGGRHEQILGGVGSESECPTDVPDR